MLPSVTSVQTWSSSRGKKKSSWRGRLAKLTQTRSMASSSALHRAFSCLRRSSLGLWIDYEKLKVVTDATNSAASLPSLPNVFKRLGKARLAVHMLR